MITLADRIRQEERDGEMIINYFRFSLALIYVVGMAVISLARNAEGYRYIPARGHIGPAIFLLYSITLFFYLRKQELLPYFLKYVCVVLDTLIISLSIFITCTYPRIYPPISFLSIQALFYTVLIVLGAFRYNSRCALFSGIFAGIVYGVLIIYYRKVIDVPYTGIFGGSAFPVAFPL
jgi:methyl-accepting chemotaxis protein